MFIKKYLLGRVKKLILDQVCEELLSKNDFEAALINFCYYEYIIVPMLLRQFRSEDWHKDTAGVMPTH